MTRGADILFEKIKSRIIHSVLYSHDEPPRKRVRKEKKVKKKKTKLQGSDAVLTEGAVHVALDRTGTPDRSGIAAREGNGETA